MSRSDFQFSLQPYTEPVYLYKCKKKIDEGGAFCLFLMDIIVGGGLRLI